MSQTGSFHIPLCGLSSTQNMHMYFGNPMLHLELQSKLKKMVCTQSTIVVFTGYTRSYQKLQMSLGSHDGKSAAHAVQHYIRGLPVNLKTLVVIK